MSLETPATTKRTYAVVWSDNGTTDPGSLELLRDGFELRGRERRLSISFVEVKGAAIARANGDRLRGLPVLVLTRPGGAPLRIACLEGAGALHELAERLDAARASAASAQSGT